MSAKIDYSLPIPSTDCRLLLSYFASRVFYLPKCPNKYTSEFFPLHRHLDGTRSPKTAIIWDFPVFSNELFSAVSSWISSFTLSTNTFLYTNDIPRSRVVPCCSGMIRWGCQKKTLLNIRFRWSLDFRHELLWWKFKGWAWYSERCSKEPSFMVPCSGTMIGLDCEKCKMKW